MELIFRIQAAQQQSRQQVSLEAQIRSQFILEIQRLDKQEY